VAVGTPGANVGTGSVSIFTTNGIKPTTQDAVTDAVANSMGGKAGQVVKAVMDNDGSCSYGGLILVYWILSTGITCNIEY